MESNGRPSRYPASSARIRFRDVTDEHKREVLETGVRHLEVQEGRLAS